jgi:hypothetical protein
MQRQILLNCLASITVLTTSLQIVNAEPAPIFRPMINQIRSQLPRGIKMRLPAAIPSPIRLYPYIESDRNSFRVNLGISPNCNRPNCTIGAIAALTSNTSIEWPPREENVTIVNLTNNISGYYLTKGNGAGATRFVYWEQEGQKYAIGAIATAVSQQQIINIASSMANSPAITSSR